MSTEGVSRWATAFGRLAWILSGPAVMLCTLYPGLPIAVWERLLYVGAALTAGTPLARHYLRYSHQEAMLREVRFLQKETMASIDRNMRTIDEAVSKLRQRTAEKPGSVPAKQDDPTKELLEKIAGSQAAMKNLLLTTELQAFRNELFDQVKEIHSSIKALHPKA